jgi:NADH-quinone oxidoreductase subunit C
MSDDSTDTPQDPEEHGDDVVEADVAAEPDQAPEAEVEAQEAAAEQVEAEAGGLDEAAVDADETAAEETDQAVGADDAVDAAEAEPEPEPEPEPELLHGAPVTWSRGQAVLHPAREDYVELVRSLREQGWWTCVDLCGVDYLGYAGTRELPPGTRAERFEVVVSLLNHAERSRLRLRVQVPQDDPTLPTLFALHPGVENPEREVFDMFGIAFTDHPDPSRILMPDEWEGHPLRKDDAVGRIPVQFKGVSSAR